ncbi:MAG: hypothetical protein IT524_07270 [Nitrosomonas sp.]|nr:hypothetical protein [Nitrosomonas sp.]
MTSLDRLTRYVVYGVSIFSLILSYSANALAKNNCDVSASLINPALLIESGIGGTGAIASDSGIGGTGIRSGGSGGTGVHSSAKPESGIGGTGIIASDSGIGGTGHHDGGIGGTGSVERGGIGGTGNIAGNSGIGGTGIVGTITGFASVCVNGVEIHYDPSTPISVDGKPATLRELAVGQIIAANAVGADRELTARNITVIHAVVGPISNLNSETRLIHVLDQTIYVAQSNQQDQLLHLKAGDWVQVSGHRLSGGTVMASRIDSIAPRPEAKINGHVTGIFKDGFEINGTRVNQDSKSSPVTVTPGMEVQVAGRWDGTRMKAQHILTEPTRQSIGNVEKVVIEGYVHAIAGKELTVNNRIITVDSGTQRSASGKDELRLGQRIQISGRVASDQRIIAEHIDTKQELSIQIQERMEKNQIDNSGKGNRNDSDRESEHKGKDSSQDNSGHGHGSRDDSSKELDRNSGSGSGKDHSSGGDSHSRDSSGSSRDSKELDHSGHGGGKPHDERPQMDRIDKLDNKPEKPVDVDARDGLNRDHSGHHDKRIDHSHIERVIDRPEKPDNLDLRDNSSNDLRDNVRDTIDIPDRARDHSHHHDRPIHDRGIDR